MLNHRGTVESSGPNKNPRRNQHPREFVIPLDAGGDPIDGREVRGFWEVKVLQRKKKRLVGKNDMKQGS